MSVAGRILYQLWHRPVGAVVNSLHHGGPLAQRAAERGRREMETAADTLPPLPARPASAGPALRVHLLTGRRFLHQTAFCLHTLARHIPVALAPEIYDDGSLATADLDRLHRLAPGLVIHHHAALRARLDKFLPLARFPVLRERWLHYPHIRKLIDIHLGRAGWRLVLDSDLLFWREPRLLLDWTTAPDRPLHATDCAENYGYSRPLLEGIAGAPLPSLINVGLCGLRSDTIDWDFLEHASAALIAAERTSYYLEQALVALLVARAGRAVAAPPVEYITLPSPAEVAQPTAIMHHYVDTARGDYFRSAWRKCVP